MRWCRGELKWFRDRKKRALVDELLRKMSTLASQVDVELPAEQLLQDALWKELTAMAAQAYNSVNDVLDR